MWTYENEEGIIEHATVRRKYLDGELKIIQLLAHEGYAMHYIHDEGFTDEEGNYYPPTYSYQVSGGTWLKIEEYEAVLIEEGMEVVNKPSKDEVI